MRVAVIAVLVALLVATSAQAGTITFNLSADNIVYYGAGNPVWTSGDVGFTTTAFGGTNEPLVLDILLSHAITTDGRGLKYDFGLSGINPAVPTDGNAFAFGMTFKMNGVAVTAPPLGWQVTNTFGVPVDNLFTGAMATYPNLTFNEVSISVTNSVPRSVNSFNADAGYIAVVPTVPEPASLLLLGTGLIGAVRAVRKRRR